MKWLERARREPTANHPTHGEQVLAHDDPASIPAGHIRGGGGGGDAAVPTTVLPTVTECGPSRASARARRVVARCVGRGDTAPRGAAVADEHTVACAPSLSGLCAVGASSRDGLSTLRRAAGSVDHGVRDRIPSPREPERVTGVPLTGFGERKGKASDATEARALRIEGVRLDQDAVLPVAAQA